LAGKDGHAPGLRGAPYWLYAAHLWAVLGIALSNILLALALLASPFALRGAVLSRATRGALLPLGFYALTLIVSAVTSYDPAASLGEVASQLFSLTPLLLGLLLVRGDRAVRTIVDGLILIGGLAAAYGLAQLFFGFGGLQLRIRGPFSHYMTFAGILLIVDLLLVAQLICDPKKRTVWRGLLFLLISAAVVASLTRSAWLALVVALAVLLAIRSARWLWLYIPAIVLAILLAPSALKERIVSIADLEDISNYDRVCMVEAGLHMLAERPIFGLGPGMVRELYPLYRHPTAPRESLPHLHNSFLQIAAESGLPALLFYLWLMGSAIAYAYRGYRKAKREGRSEDLYLGAFAALIAFNLAGVFEDNWGDSEIQRIVAFLIALPHCLWFATESGRGEPLKEFASKKRATERATAP